ncbi:unnamed protein product [Parnassius apollo]|uniref:(apollo) hypothetical protein n=1 Tax=Parnassius apollo TaxID=110799 RepID=A0A8S3WAD3_PARAO|nr:unnamed protein product [Parnassius apollo]
MSGARRSVGGGSRGRHVASSARLRGRGCRVRRVRRLAARPSSRHSPAGPRHARRDALRAGPAARRAPGPHRTLAARVPRAPAGPGAPMEPPWELELELRRHIENCACTCDHMGYGNYMDYRVAPAAHACLCRAITSPHAHVCVVPASHPSRTGLIPHVV